jgi:hypothetical protein
MTAPPPILSSANMYTSVTKSTRDGFTWVEPNFTKRTLIGCPVPDSLTRIADAPLRRVSTGADFPAIRTALETAGVERVAENGGGPWVRLRKAVGTQISPEHLIIWVTTHSGRDPRFVAAPRQARLLQWRACLAFGNCGTRSTVRTCLEP